MLRPTVPHLRRLNIRPGHWGQWLATGTAGLVGFVVLALLLVFETEIGQLDQRLLSGVISLRSPGFTAFASAVTRLGSAAVVVPLGIAAAVILGLRSRKILLPIALLATLAATASLVTILKIALDRPRPPAELVVGRATLERRISVGSYHRRLSACHSHRRHVRPDRRKCSGTAAAGDQRMSAGAVDRLQPHLPRSSLAQ